MLDWGCHLLLLLVLSASLLVSAIIRAQCPWKSTQWGGGQLGQPKFVVRLICYVTIVRVIFTCFEVLSQRQNKNKRKKDNPVHGSFHNKNKRNFQKFRGCNSSKLSGKIKVLEAIL